MFSVRPYILSLFILLSLRWDYCSGLTCYSCNTDGVGPDCIDNPNKYTTVPCAKDDVGNLKDHCYTYRIEENNAETGELEITVDRSCCAVTESSSVCRSDFADFEVVTTDTYTQYFTRCKDELCNDGPGDNSDDADNGGDADRSILVVPGRPDNYKK